MSLTVLDYTNCSQRKCRTPNGGVYDCDNPCQNGANFDFTTGDCDGTCGDGDVQNLLVIQNITYAGSGATLNDIQSVGGPIEEEVDPEFCYAGSNTYVRCDTCPTCSPAYLWTNYRDSNTQTCTEVTRNFQQIESIEVISEIDEFCCIPEAGTTWQINFNRYADTGQATCSTCVEPSGPFFDSTTIAFTGLLVAPISFANYASISGDCPQGPVNCDKTLAEAYAIDWLYNPSTGALNAQQNNAQCGQASSLVARFKVTAVLSGNPGILVGDILGYTVNTGWGGSVGCMHENYATGVGFERIG